MTRVFIGGSRHASQLGSPVHERLDNIIAKGFPVLVGDANGADKAVQQYLHDRHYPNVEVFCSNGVCRNNIGGWPIRTVPTDIRERSAQFYSAKDRVMANEATVGLMVWDGKSVGTLLNAFRLLGQGKKAVIYTVPDARFLELRSAADWDDFIADCEPGLKRKVAQRAESESAPERPPAQTSFV